MYDVAIIGCGVIGAAAAYALSRYENKVVILEAENDVADCTTKANSAILHAGYDPAPGTKMARLNVRGVELAKEICTKLDVPYKQCGSLVLALSESELPHLQHLYENGTANGVPDMKILTKEETLAMEPNLSENVCGALWAPSAAIVSPWEYALAMTEVAVRNGVELRRSCRQLTRIPAEEYMAYSELTNRASDVWHKAKEENDFASFCPILQELVEYNRKFAGYYDAEKAPYDALLNEYERGMDTQQLDVFFDTLRKGLVPLIRAIGEKPQIDDSFLHLEYPVEQQKAFADYLMEVMGLDRGHCGLGETEHPFTLEFNNKDVRITTNYDLHNVASSMYSVLHEGGHALYELGIRDDLQYTCLTGGVSMGVHESQSRFYENLIGRSRAFIGAIYPKVQEFFPAQLGNVTAEQFYRAVNKVEPSLIRTESDELTYCLHVMVRYEIEKQLIAGTLTAKEVPAVWAELYKEYLGVEVPNDREGCLQDSHWSGGSFGYFPSYALGNAYGAQMLHNMEQEFDVYGGVAHGDLSAVTGWLREKVHQYGHLLEPAEVVRNACGTFDAHYYLDYLTKKYTELYNL